MQQAVCKKQNRQAKSIVFQVLSGKAWSTVLGVRCCQARSQKSCGANWFNMERYRKSVTDSTRRFYKRIHKVLDNQLIIHLYNIVQSYEVVYWIMVTTHFQTLQEQVSHGWTQTNSIFRQLASSSNSQIHMQGCGMNKAKQGREQTGA